MSDSADYRKKKAFFDNLLTIYGRKPVLEALQDPSIPIYKLHLADSNKVGGIIDDILRAAKQRAVEIQWHDKKTLSRISKNSSQDQGVAADLQLDKHQSIEDFLQQCGNRHFRLVALDGITNPQNLGMIIRSVCASTFDGLILPKKGCAALSPLVIKASAGTALKTRILRCDDLCQALEQLKGRAILSTLSSHATASLFDFKPEKSAVYVLGNETDGVSPAIASICEKQLAIPMNNGVESLNVAITTALIVFKQ